jgi:hypothetical protein
MTNNKKFRWIHREPIYPSINILSKNLTEFITSFLIDKGFKIEYSYEKIHDDAYINYVGSLFNFNLLSSLEKDLTKTQSILDVSNIHGISDVNKITNLQVHFFKNTENLLIPEEIKGKFDCCICSAAGLNPLTIPNMLDMPNGSKVYVVDISAISIEISKKIIENWKNGLEVDINQLSHHRKSMIEDIDNDVFKNINNIKKINNIEFEFKVLDIFDIEAVKSFVKEINKNKIFWSVTNCFNYLPTAILYDIKTRFALQKEFFNVLYASNKNFYIDCTLADANYYQTNNIKKLLDLEIDKRFEVLPWHKRI